MENNEYKVCHICGGKMDKCVNSVTFRKDDKYYEIPNVTYYQCPICREKVFDAAEIKRIDNELRNPAHPCSE